MKKIFSIILSMVFVMQVLTPATAIAKKKPKIAKSQLEVRQMQTHIFNTPDKTEVLKAAIATLQDEGYMILNVEDELGYIEARREYKAVRINKGRLTFYYFYFAIETADTVFSYGAMAGYMIDAVRRIHNETSPRSIIVDSNVTVEPFGKKQTKVRFTLVEKELENADGYAFIKASPRKVVRFYAEPVYQAFFSELDKSIFYENNKV